MPSLLRSCTSWETRSNFRYGSLADQWFDAYIPKGNGTNTNPLIVTLHGGGWDSGTEDYNWFESNMVAGVVRRGFAVASVRYRLSGTAKWPAQIKDVLAAVRELRYRGTSWRIWPDKIGVWGFSAGAHLAALAGVAGDDPAFQPTTRVGVSNAVACVAADYPPTDFRAWVQTPGFTHLQSSSSFVSRLFGYPVLSKPAVPDAASPALRVTAQAAPLYLRHGTADTTVPVGQSERLRDAYTAAGVGQRCTYLPKPGAKHADLAFYTSAEISALCGWFDQHLQP